MQDGLLDQLTDIDRRTLLTKMVRRSFRKNEILFHQGDPGDTVHVIERGHVAIRCSTPNGDVATLAILGVGESFGEQALLSPAAVRTASAVALDATETRSLHRRDFEVLRASTPAVERFLIQVLAAQVRRLSSQLVDALYVPAEQRVIRRLVEVADVYACADLSIEVPLRQDDLASLAGTARPTANRVLRSLEEAGVITLARGQITVVDMAALRTRAR